MAWIDAESAALSEETGLKITLEHMCSGEAFLTPVGPFVSAVQDAVAAVAGRRPEASTTGGTSDARFIRALCPVLELGPVGSTMHQINECVPTEELQILAGVYEEVIRRVQTVLAA